MRLSLLPSLAFVLVLAGCDSRRTASGAIEVGECRVSGCFSELCSDQADLASSCEWRPELACYRNATCAPGEDGVCGWMQTEELQSCLASGGPATRPCGSDSECPGGYVCESCGSGGMCVRGCRNDWQCPFLSGCHQVLCFACPCPKICG